MRPFAVLLFGTLTGCSSADLVVAGADDAATADTTPDDVGGDVGVDAADDSSVAIDSAVGDDSGSTPDASPDALAEVPSDVGDDGGHDDAIDVEIGGDASTDGPLGDALDAACDVLLRCYYDRDADGYVSTAGAFDACLCPSGTKTIAATGTLFDCSDEDPAVHPGAAFHDGAYCVPGTGCSVKSFDYDCNGSDDRELATAFTGCSTFSTGCTGNGWQGTTVAACGVTQNFVTCAKATLSCSQTVTARVQRCR